jgi:aminopeptidase N
LGEYYTEEALRFRVENRDKFQKACRDKIAAASGMEREFNVAIDSIIVLFYNRQIQPHKTIQYEPYTFKNDYRITRLLKCAKLISTDGVTADNIQSKTEAVQNRNAEIYKQIKQVTENQKIRTDLISSGEQMFGGSAVSDETRKFLKSYGIENMQDIENLHNSFIENNTVLQGLQTELDENKTKLGAYRKIADMYSDMKYGSYIDKLIHEEQERQAALLRRDEREEIE